MENPAGAVRYALRQFWSSPVFTAAAVLTLALGIGGTTAIFTLIHAVMLRSLPVADPASLYRIGDGDDCCVEGGPQDRWGMFSFPLFERLKAETPEFEQVAAFQAGGARVERAARRRRRGRPAAAVGVRHRQLLLDARRRRVRRPRPRRRTTTAVGAAGRGAQPSRLAERVRRRPVGRRLDLRHRRPSVHGDRRRAAGIFRRNAARRSARPVDSAAAGAADRRRQRAAAPAGRRRGCA